MNDNIQAGYFNFTFLERELIPLFLSKWDMLKFNMSHLPLFSNIYTPNGINILCPFLS